MPAVSETVSPSVPSKKKKSRGRTPDGSPNPVDVYVGKRIKLRRQALNLSQYTVAELLGLTFQQIQKYEKGNNRISASRLWDYACVLRVPIQFFFQDMDPAVYSCSPRLQYCPAEFKAESLDNEPYVNNDDLMSRSENVLLVYAFSRIQDRSLAKCLLRVIMGLAHCPFLSKSVEIEDAETAEEEINAENVNPTESCLTADKTIHLHRKQLVVAAFLTQQLFVAAVFDNSALVKHQNAVHFAQGGKPVGNRQHRFALHQVGQRFLNMALALAVQRRSRFVKNQDRRVFQNGARYRNPLSFAAGKNHPAVAYFGLVTIGEFADKNIGKRFLSGGLNLPVRSVGFAVADIFRQGAVKQAYVLRNHRNVAVQRILRHLADIVAGDANSAAGLTKVDLPEPDKPTSPTFSPAPISTLRFRNSGLLPL